MTDFTAIILAAGVGSRLRPLTNDRPKCLVSLGSETILARMVRLLVTAGAREIIVATGYRAEAIRESLAHAQVVVRYAHCSDYDTTQNVVSLCNALREWRGGDIVKLDGDLAFDLEVLTRLLEGADGGARVAVEDGEVPPEEAMKVMAEGRMAKRFGKSLPAKECFGESIGVEWFHRSEVKRLVTAMEGAVSSGRTHLYYEDVYNDLLSDALPMHCVSVRDLRWNEIDDHTDLAHARTQFT
jgi:choline kinase